MIAWLCRFQYLNNPFQWFDNYAQLLYRANIPLVVMSLRFSQLPNLFLTLTPLSAIMVVFNPFFLPMISLILGAKWVFKQKYLQITGLDLNKYDQFSPTSSDFFRVHSAVRANTNYVYFAING